MSEEAIDLFRRIDEVVRLSAQPSPLLGKLMHETLLLVCHVGLRGQHISFGNLMSQTDYLCRELKLRPGDVAAVQKMRRDSKHAEKLSQEDLLYDCLALAELVAAVTRTPIPAQLIAQLPQRKRPTQRKVYTPQRCIRCIVRQKKDFIFIAETDADSLNGELVSVDCSDKEQTYVADMVHEGTQLNLIDCEQTSAEPLTLKPRLVVVEPDFLIDISSIAACFTNIGHHPLAYTIKRLSPSANTQAILLGNFAGRALNDIINSHEDYRWQNTFVAHFREQSLEYCTCPDLNKGTDFKTSAQQQVAHIQQIVDELFEKENFQRDKAMLEPSFVCEQLGLQGRADLMTTDLNLLVEQKSGKNFHVSSGRPNAYGSLQKEDHYVQLLLYYGVLRHNFHTSMDKTDMRLLYSKYPLPGGLVSVSFYDKLFREAIKVRNGIAANEFRIAIDGFEAILPELTPETLNEKGDSGTLFTQYIAPQTRAACDPLRTLEGIERDYVCRMMTFVYREQLCSKLGNHQHAGHAAADLWNMPLAEKVETGNIYSGLTITSKDQSSDISGYDLITLSVPDQGETFLSNFRTGDSVYLYAYQRDAEPDVRTSWLFKGTLIDIRPQQLRVVLSDGQQNPHVICGDVWAVEHADLGGSSAVRSLATFAQAPLLRRQLLLSQRQPQRDPSITLTRSYHPDYDPILLKAKQAKDYFLVVGPPGTGKTSLALRFLVQEELASGSDNAVLLLSYTNRAVDEICDMLTDAHIDFLRIGKEFACDARFRPRILKNAVSHLKRLDDIKAFIRQTRVFVATTQSMSSQQGLFRLRRFSLLVVDEASQILEPQIVGLLCMGVTSDHQPRFILIGDHKQLPAVVQQDEDESAVESVLLRDICLDNCRNSLFERLLRYERKQQREDFIGILRKQGRMHPDIAEFPNRMFYRREQLCPVPCPHQRETSISYDEPSLDALDDCLKANRMIFIPSEDCREMGLSDKVNPHEADIVAELLRRLHRFYGERFDAHKTVGVIVPYRNQIAMIRQRISRLGIPALQDVSIDTVERYQGSQRDVIIYSLTIQNAYQLEFLTGNSFIEDGDLIDRKLNVAITRARRQLIITGHASTVSRSPLYAQLIQHIRKTGQTAFFDEKVCNVKKNT